MSNPKRNKEQGITYADTYNWSLFKYAVNDLSHYFILTSELPNNGFGSLYYIKESDKDALTESGPAGFKGVVWSPSLWIDTDTEEAAVQTGKRLITLGLSYKQYRTGNRGAHFEIPRPHEPSHMLPLKDKLWVKENVPWADLSIYTHLHLFRLTGTVHSETGLKKEAVAGNHGRTLTLYDLPIESIKYDEVVSEAAQSVFLNQAVMSMTVPADEGGRNRSLTNLAVSLKHLGEGEAFISRWLYHVNLLYSSPVEQEEIDKIVDWVRNVT